MLGVLKRLYILCLGLFRSHANTLQFGQKYIYIYIYIYIHTYIKYKIMMTLCNV